MAKISEEPLSESMLSAIDGAAGEGKTFLGLHPSVSPDEVVETIDRYVHQWQQGHRNLPESIDADDVPYTLGSLWGEQLVGKFGWEWVMVTLHEQDEARMPAVVSPDRALAVYPIHFLADCLQDETVDPKIAMAFDVLEARRVDDAQPREYVDLIERVQGDEPGE